MMSKGWFILGALVPIGNMYPKPMEEEALLTGVLYPTNEPYAVSKITRLTMCESYNRQHVTRYHTVITTNINLIHNNLHPGNSCVIPGKMCRIHEAKVNDLPEVFV